MISSYIPLNFDIISNDHLPRLDIVAINPKLDFPFYSNLPIYRSLDIGILDSLDFSIATSQCYSSKFCYSHDDEFVPIYSITYFNFNVPHGSDLIVCRSASLGALNSSMVKYSLVKILLKIMKLKVFLPK